MAPEFDLAAAHRWFSADCFNRVWDLLDKPDRTPDDDQLMVSMCHASLYHWRQRPDCSSRSLSIGYWQLSRVYAVLNQAENARNFSRQCLQVSNDESPFYLGYAFEAAARAESVAGNPEGAAQFLALARQQASQVTDSGEREMLEKDLATIKAT